MGVEGFGDLSDLSDLSVKGMRGWTMDHRPYLPAEAKASASAGGDHGPWRRCNRLEDDLIMGSGGILAT